MTNIYNKYNLLNIVFILLNHQSNGGESVLNKYKSLESDQSNYHKKKKSILL